MGPFELELVCPSCGRILVGEKEKNVKKRFINLNFSSH